MSDKAFEQLQPCFSGETALHLWLEAVLDKAAAEYVREYRREKEMAEARKKVFATIQLLKANPEANVNLNGILGKPREDFSWDKLREDALYDKYGI